MRRVCPPAAGCRQVEIEGHRYTVRRDGSFHVRDEHVAALRRHAECFLPTTRVGGTGWRCPSCGFLAAFARDCGRCGAPELEREG